MPQEDEPRRAGGRDELLRPKRIDGVVVSVDCGDQLAKTLPANAKHFDRLVVVTATHDTRSQRVARDCGTDLVVTDACYDGGDAFNKGRMLNAGLSTLDPRLSDWLLFHDADVFLPPTLGSDLRGLILNPGCLYYTRRHHLPHDVREPDWALVTDYDLLDPAGNHNPWGYFQLVNVRAQAIRSRFSTLDSRLFPDCFCSAGSIDNWLAVQWPHDKRVSLADWAGNRRFDVLHLWHGPFGERWNGARGHAAGWRFAGQSDVATQDRWQSLWPVPCLLRRIHIRTCDQETIEYRGGSPQWRRTSDPSAVYEYSVRSPTQ
jgi:hypothetical protein